MTADQANRARGGEFHARLAERIPSGEVVLGVNLDGQDALATLHAGRRSDVLTEGTAHTLRNTVCTSTGGLLVFPKDMVGEGVNTEGIPLCSSRLTNGGVRNHTGCFQGCVTNLNIVVRSEFDNNGELSRLSSTAVPDVELVNTVVWNTADVLAAGVGWAFQTTVHHSWFSCHRYPSKQPCDRCSLYHISARAHRLG